MVVFLADRSNLRVRRLHRRLANRCQSDDRFGTVRLTVADRRDPGPYRVVAEIETAGLCLGDPAETDTRLEVGFALTEAVPHEYYWFNWIEADRDLLAGWHQDATHSDLGPVHVQLNQGDRTVTWESATFVDKHPMAVFEVRLDQLPALLGRIEFDGETATGLT